MAENDAISAPMTKPEALKFLAKIGSSGSTMPKPIRSMKTVRKMINTDGFFICSAQHKRPGVFKLAAGSVNDFTRCYAISFAGAVGVWHAQSNPLVIAAGQANR